jgi:hypothetical protein
MMPKTKHPRTLKAMIMRRRPLTMLDEPQVGEEVEAILEASVEVVKEVPEACLPFGCLQQVVTLGVI